MQDFNNKLNEKTQEIEDIIYSYLPNELNKQKDKIQKLKTEFLDDVKAKGTIEINKFRVKVYNQIIFAINKNDANDLKIVCSNLLKKINDKIWYYLNTKFFK